MSRLHEEVHIGGAAGGKQSANATGSALQLVQARFVAPLRHQRSPPGNTPQPATLGRCGKFHAVGLRTANPIKPIHMTAPGLCCRKASRVRTT